MGDPSTLRFVPAESSTTPIDWTKVPEASKKILLDGWGYDWEKNQVRPLPATVGDLAKMVDDCNFFGYLNPNLCTLLLDISEFGLAGSSAGQANSGAIQVGPRFYMNYLSEVWFLLFMPGKRDGIVGNGPKVRSSCNDDEDDEEFENANAANELAMAQAFDLELERVVRGGSATMVDITQELAGWEASTLQKSLEQAQYAHALLSLPRGHPALSSFMETVFADLRR